MGEEAILDIEKSVDLKSALAALSKDHASLAARIRVLTHTIACPSTGVTLRLHFPSFRQGKPTVAELVDAISTYLVHFALPRSEIEKLKSVYHSIEAVEFMKRYSILESRARALFIKANQTTNRNGEAGELLLYLLTEWMLGAPQLIAKMALKTNPNMPVHGSDGVHVRYREADKKLLLYWGESKLYADVGEAITSAAKSIGEALKPEKLQHEINLVQQNIDFSGLKPEEKEALLRYLNPFEEDYNERHDVATCLVGFDFDGFSKVAKANSDKAEVQFRSLAEAELAKVAPALEKALTEAGLETQPVEIFFFPVPSVGGFRDLFQKKIGWKS
ncbi:hypothetical protein SSBR45G_40790 [Bradyrhizobium sp. SSBR45G]|nr:hypothetical protein SSBR45G_40790 [Bradyrhizobium sp. SSBR45G]GLH84605.1 hypothetical protein SSBR45R_20650 [Bradyrhizobium sp. SSBR45R]